MKTQNFAKTSVWISVILVVGYIFAFLKESVIANYFGVSLYVDAYNIAIQIPVIVFAFVAVAVKSVVIPLYSDLYYNRGNEDANRFASGFITLNILIALLFVLVGEVFGDMIISLFAPGFNQQTHDIAVELLRVTMPTIIFTVVTDIITGVLNVHKKLVLPCFAVYFLQLAIILFLVILRSQLGIKAACLGQVLGSMIQMSFLIFIARKIFKYRFVANFKAPEIVKALKMSGPVIWGISIAEVNAMVNRMVGSFLFVGSISALSYASKINSVFMAFCVHAISMVVYPLFSESSAKKDMNQLNRRVNFTLSVYTALLLPVMCGVFCLRKEIIEIAFARGAFDADAVMLTKSVLGCYVVGMLFSAFRETLTKVFFSMKDTATVAKNATLGVTINIVLNVTLPWILGVQGLAISASISAMFISIRLLWLLKKKHKGIDLSVFFSNLKGIVLPSLIVLAVLFIVERLLSGMNSYMLFGIGVLITGFLYIGGVIIINPPLVNELKKHIIK